MYISTIWLHEEVPGTNNAILKSKMSNIYSNFNKNVFWLGKNYTFQYLSIVLSNDTLIHWYGYLFLYIFLLKWGGLLKIRLIKIAAGLIAVSLYIF